MSEPIPIPPVDQAPQPQPEGPTGTLGPCGGPPDVPAPRPNTGPPLFPAAPQTPPAAPPSLLARLWEKAGTVPWGKAAFALVFITAATFYFKDQRLAEEKAKQPQAQPLPPVPPDWDRMTDEELAKLGFRKVTQEELDREIVPGVVVVYKGNQNAPGYRVVGVEGDYAFVEDLGDRGRFTALLLLSVERKKP